MDIKVWDGDIVWRGDEIILCDGVTNTIQQAYLETITDKGESLFYQEYGTRIYQKIGKIASSGNQELIQQEVLNVFSEMQGVEVQTLNIEDTELGWQVNLKFIDNIGNKYNESFIIGGENAYELANER